MTIHYALFELLLVVYIMRDEKLHNYHTVNKDNIHCINR